jgi:protein-S-isoprenylcysteine O-methyltransferase Ste14
MLLLKNLLFTVVVPGTVAVYLPLWIAGGRPAADGLLLVVALGFFIVGAAIYGWCVWDFATLGRATPIPLDAPKKLVVRGLYRFSRNPMYVGVLGVILGWAVLFQAWSLLLYGLAVATCFQLFIVLYEEPHLRRMFGDPYDVYRAQVGRWLPRRPETR